MIKNFCALSAAAASVQAVKVKSKCPFGFTSSQPESQELIEVKENTTGAQFPSQILTCPTGRIGITEQFSVQQYEELAEQIIQKQFESSDPVNFAACLLRLEGHDLMDFRRETRRNKRGKLKMGQPKVYGGSDGCVNFEDGDNAGLPQCLAWTGLNEIYGHWCGQLSLADFMVLAAEASIGSIAEGFDSDYPFADGTLLASLRDQFKIGRETLEECPENEGLMPNPENGCDDLQAIFIDHIYNGKWNKRKAWGFTAALSGAHTIGSAKPENSGYDGLWGDPENQAIFNNDYFKNIMAHGWGPQRAVGGNPDKNQWQLIDSSDEVEKGRQMMLNTDMCLFYQYNTLHADCMRDNGRNHRACNEIEKQGGFLNAKNATCCAWTNKKELTKRFIVNVEEQNFCGVEQEETNLMLLELDKSNKWSQMSPEERKEKMKQKRVAKENVLRDQCCQDEMDGSIGDCDSFRWPKGPAMNLMLKYAASNEVFYEAFLQAWQLATENGWELSPMQ